MNPSLDPMPKRAQALLDLEREEAEPDAGASSRMWSAIAAQLPSAPLPPTRAPRGLGRPLARFTLGHAVVLGVTAFGLGAGLGHFATQTARPSAPPVSTAVLPAPPPITTLQPTMPSEPEAPVPAAAVPPRAAPAVAAPLRPASRPVARPAVVASEREPIAEALEALERSDPTAALAALARHAERFPSGQLAEEREALRVRALVALGHRDEAGRAARAFAERFPQSLLAPSVKAVLAAPAP